MFMYIFIYIYIYLLFEFAYFTKKKIFLNIEKYYIEYYTEIILYVIIIFKFNLTSIKIYYLLLYMYNLLI